MTTEIAIVMAIVVFAVFLFVTELLRVDVVAILIMTLLGLLVYLPGFDAILDVDILFSGLSSNAVVSIIAVMILGAGLEKSGVTERVAWAIHHYGARTERPLMAFTSGAVSVVSAFMQNVGATALILPVIARVSSHTRVPMSRLVMPAGFCAILGGSITMVGSSPLIMLNDLVGNSNRALPAAQQVGYFGLFDVAPVGLALVAGGLLYFLFLGQRLLPTKKSSVSQRGRGTVRYMRRAHGINAAVREIEVLPDCPLIGRDILSVQQEYEVRIVASSYANKVLVAPPLEAPIAAPATLAVIAEPQALRKFIAVGHLHMRPKLREFRHLLARSIAGIADLVVPPNSDLIGKTVREVRMRMTYGLSLLSIYRGGEAITTRLQEVPFQAGDTLICHTRWEHLAQLERDRNFVVVTVDYPRTERSPYKVALALTFFAIAIGLVVFTDILLPVALMTGAAGMIVFGVLEVDEAYHAVSWKSVFLLAGMLPLGRAVESSGAANYLAQHLLFQAGDSPVWVLQTAVAIIGTLFSVVMSNVGATVLLVPIAINLALAIGADPAMFALTAAVSTSNSFILPTHQVNALIMGPGDYRVTDFLRVGSIMTVLYMLISLVVLNLMF